MSWRPCGTTIEKFPSEFVVSSGMNSVSPVARLTMSRSTPATARPFAARCT